MQTTSSRPRLAQRVRGMTYEQFKDFLQGEQKGDLIDGIAKIMAPAPFAHEDTQGFLLSIMRFYVRSKDLGAVVGSRVLVRIDDKNGYEPDILFVSKERAHIIKRMELAEAPDVAVEIISKSSRIDDRARKFNGYERAGVKEYWLIDPDRREVEFFRHTGEEFIEVEPVEGVFRSEVIQGFYLKPEWLFAEPLPSELSIFQELAQGT